MAKMVSFDATTGVLIERDLSDEELADLHPPQTAEDVRSKRNYTLAIVVDPLVSNPLRWSDLTPEQQQAWANYRRALLDVPQQPGFPENVIWPTAPNEVTA
jgi:hypothetical protein